MRNDDRQALVAPDAGLTGSLQARLDVLERKLDVVLELLGGRRKDFYTVEEVAEALGRSAYTVRRWILEKKLSATRVQGGPRGRLLVRREDFDRLVANGLAAELTAVEGVVDGEVGGIEFPM